jgi:predicted aspartyl protease
MVERLGLKTKKFGAVVFRDAHGDKLDEKVTVSSISIGKAKVDKPFDFIVAGDATRKDEQGGTFGMNILETQDLELDPANKKVGFYSPDHCRGQVVYWASSFAELPMRALEGNLATTITLDGKNLTAIVDTGASGTVIDSGLAWKEFGVDLASGDAEHVGQSGAASGSMRDSYERRFSSMDFSGVVKIANPLIEVSDLGKQVIILGMDYMNHLHMYFSFKEKKIYLTAATAGME